MAERRQFSLGLRSHSECHLTVCVSFFVAGQDDEVLCL